LIDQDDNVIHIKGWKLSSKSPNLNKWNEISPIPRPSGSQKKSFIRNISHEPLNLNLYSTNWKSLNELPNLSNDYFMEIGDRKTKSFRNLTPDIMFNYT